MRATHKKLSIEHKDDKNTQQHAIRIFINLLMCCSKQQETRMTYFWRGIFFNGMKSQSGRIQGIFKTNFDHISSCRGCGFPTQILFTWPLYPSVSGYLYLHLLQKIFLSWQELLYQKCLQSYMHCLHPAPAPPITTRASYCLTGAGSLASEWDKFWSNLCSRAFCGIRLR